jgi:hypothetical protein
VRWNLGLPPDVELGAGWDTFIASLGRPAPQENIKTLIVRGFHKPGDIQDRLGYDLGQLTRLARRVMRLLVLRGTRESRHRTHMIEGRVSGFCDELESHVDRVRLSARSCRDSRCAVSLSLTNPGLPAGYFDKDRKEIARGGAYLLFLRLRSVVLGRSRAWLMTERSVRDAPVKYPFLRCST